MFSLKDKKFHIFDCDGVLVDSNQLKIDALNKTLTNIGCSKAFIDWASDEFKNNFGRTRIEHFKVFVDHKSKDGFRLDPALVESAITEYGELVEVLYENCSLISETISFIASNFQKENIYIVSASSQNELRNIIPKRIKFFKKENIFGGPTKKSINLSNISKKVGKNNIVFYGDAIQDAQASIDTGIYFIGLSKYSANPSLFKEFCLNNRLEYVNDCSDIFNE